MLNYSAKNNRDKQKMYNKFLMLEIRDILWKESVEEHPLTIDEICRILEDMGLPCNARTVAENINDLRQYEINLKIEQTMKGNKKAYYCRNRLFTLGEIIYLIEEIRGSKSISKVESERIIHKIKHFVSAYEWENVIEKLPVKFARTHDNHDVCEYIGTTGLAISQKKQVRFLYYDVGSYHTHVHRHDSQIYQVNPLQIVVDNDRCYMIGYDMEKREIRHYRFDRMDRVEKLELEREPEAEKALPDVEKSLDEMVEMYGGEKLQMVIEFDKEIIYLLRNQFGDEIVVGNAGNGRLRSKINVQKSPPLFARIFLWGSNVKIIWPQQLKDEYLNIINEIAAQYHMQLVEESSQLKIER